MYVYGGYSSNGEISNTFYALDLKTRVWKTVPLTMVNCKGVPPLMFHTACVYLDKLIIYGGKTSSTSINPSIYMINLSTFELSKFSINMEPRYAHAACIVDSIPAMIIHGGRCLDQIFKETFFVDLSFLDEDGDNNNKKKKKAKSSKHGNDKISVESSINAAAAANSSSSSSVISLSVTSINLETYCTNWIHSVLVNEKFIALFGGTTQHLEKKVTREEIETQKLVLSLLSDEILLVVLSFLNEQSLFNLQLVSKSLHLVQLSNRKCELVDEKKLTSVFLTILNCFILFVL